MKSSQFYLHSQLSQITNVPQSAWLKQCMIVSDNDTFYYFLVTPEPGSFMTGMSYVTVAGCHLTMVQSTLKG